MNELFGTLSDGTPVHRWTLERGGTRVRVLTYGGIVQSVEVPDREGRAVDVVLGFADLDGYLRNQGPFFGALIGRYANRIARGRFTLDGRTYELECNNPPNSLHGGALGFDKRVWDAEAVEGGVRLFRVSPDGEEGFPGRLEVSATYTLDEDGRALRVSYEAVTDAPTVVNLTNHSYWNLAGASAGSAGGHELRIDAARVTPVNGDLIPTGELAEVEGTRFDFRVARKVGAGYDHNFVLDKGVTGGAEVVAELFEPGSGRVLTVATTEPGMQVYTADHLEGAFGPGDGIALETQHFPDSPNRPQFPSTELRPGGVYRSETVYGFGVR
ncbi:aldose epimerase family protein [Streptomyces capitiformicae]|uniref:Aldose 1-epimerase n=1 Tax=Streptomyces capitiformicae TaxID=2014920 RepID=A0A919L4F8_9ACTN|nr:aldose epimerase family protein [Streptomyces capitiformicae]GHH83427.1 aldose 1-epimerase [Streptomyces capitiformicae]